MIVEFIGISGAGKSAVARALVRCIGAHGLDARLRFVEFDGPLRVLRARVFKNRLILRHLLGNPRAASAAVRLVRSSRQSGLRDAARLVQSYVYLDGIRASERSECDVLVLHQGFAQLLYSISLSTSGDPTEMLSRLHPRMPAADVYVLITAAPSVIAARLAAREGPGGRLQHRAREDESVIDESLALFERLGRLLEGDGRTVYRRVSSAETRPEEIAEGLATSIVALQRSGRVEPARAGEGDAESGLDRAQRGARAPR